MTIHIVYRLFLIFSLVQLRFSPLSAKSALPPPTLAGDGGDEQFFAAEGSKLRLKCPIPSDWTATFDVSWSLNDQPIIGRNLPEFSIPTISKIDAGVYRCAVKNDAGTVLSAPFNVTVSYFEGFDGESSDLLREIKVSRNKFVTIRPPKLKGRGLFDIIWKWFYESEEIISDDIHYITKDGELVILETRDHYGGYRVEAQTETGVTFGKMFKLSEDTSIFPHEAQFVIAHRPRNAELLLLRRRDSANDDDDDFGQQRVAENSAVFECVASSWGTQGVQFRWFFNGDELAADEHLDGVRFENGGGGHRRMVISADAVAALLGGSNDGGGGSVPASHFATVRCMAETRDGLFQDHADARLEILEPPRIEKHASKVIKSVGDAVKLECSERSAWPRSKVYWYFNGAKISHLPSNNFRIEKLRQKDYGVYQCEAANSVGSMITQFWIGNGERHVVHRKVEIVVEPPSDLEVKLGEDIVLPCRTQANDNSLISWNFNDTDVNSSGLRAQRIATNATALIVKLARKSDAGKYTCVVKSADGTTTAEASSKVVVLEPSAAIIEYGPSNQSMLIGSNIQMPCKLSHDYANRGDVTITWLRNGREIFKSADISHRISINDEGSLLINQVGPDNIGMYTCQARAANNQSESVTAWLRIIEKPAMPQNVNVELKNESMPIKIRIDWEPGFDGNSPIIKYVVEIRTVGSSGLWSDWETVLDNIPSEMCCTAVVDSVKPSEMAQFRVIAFNRHGAGKASSASKSIKVPQQPPADAPRQVAASSRSASSVMVQWQPPPAGQWNGDIKGYMIRYRLSGYATADWNEKNVSNEHARNALIEPLITWREYDIQVAAFNDRGLGVYSKPIEVTTLEGVPIQSPQNVNVEVLNSTAIQVSFDPPDQQMIPGVNLGYKVELWKGGFKSSQPFRIVRVFPESARISEQIGGLEKFGHYNLTVLCLTAPGDGPRSDPLEVITLEDVPGPLASISFDQILYSSVLVKWEPPAEPNGIILKYTLRYWRQETSATASEEKHTIDVSAVEENSLEIDGLSASTRYFVDICAVTKVGGGPRIEASFESGVTPELPGRPTSLTVSDVGARTVSLQFVPGFDGHSFIRRWIVEARVGASSIFSAIFNANVPKATSLIVEGLRPNTKYQLRLIAENVRGRSAPSDPTRAFHTSTTFPESAPEKVYAEPVSARQIQVSWTPLAAAHWNGEPMGYVVLTRLVSSSSGGEKSTINTDSSSSGAKDDLKEWNETLVSNAKASDFVLQDLRPFQSYQIKVCAKNSFGNSRFSEVVFATTYESAPNGVPKSVLAEWDEKQSVIRVKWGHVTEADRNGHILGYVVRATPLELESSSEDSASTHKKVLEVLGADILSAEISALRPASTYRISVAAFTLIGEGPTADGGSATTAESLPGKPSNVSFPYTSSSEVRLAWDRPVEPNGKILGYSIRYWRADRPEQDAVNTQIPSNVEIFSATSLTPDSIYAFAIKAETSVGWGAERRVEVLTSAKTLPLPVPSVPSRNMLSAQQADKIHLSWSIIPTSASSSTDESVGRGISKRDAEISAIRGVEVEYRKLQMEQKAVSADENFWQRAPHTLEPDLAGLTFGGLLPNTAYKVRIRFVGDGAMRSIWSYESEWIKTLEAPPAKSPELLHVGPYERSSALVKWRALERDAWNSEKIGYRILYRVYAPTGVDTASSLSPTTFSVEDVELATSPMSRTDSGEVGGVESAMTNVSSDGTVVQHILKNLLSFRHYVIQVKAVNAMGTSGRPQTPPLFVYVGYAVPKQTVQNLAAKSLTSTSIQLTWDGPSSSSNSTPLDSNNNKNGNDGEMISGYRIRYTPTTVLDAMGSLSAEIAASLVGEEVVTTDKCCEFTLMELRKYTDYQIFVAAYNRAGEGQASATKTKTLEDVPGPVGALVFEDVLLNSVNVSWAPPTQPNGRVLGYVVNYRTYKLEAEFRREIQEKTQLTYLVAGNLEENVTYLFFVRAETTAGRGAETSANVTIGFNNEGAPLAVSRPTILLEHSTFLLRWQPASSSSNTAGESSLLIKGHLIQAKRVATVKSGENAAGVPQPASSLAQLGFVGAAMQRRSTNSSNFVQHAMENSVNSPMSEATNAFAPVAIGNSAAMALSTSDEDEFSHPPRHPIGEWLVLSNVLGAEVEFRVAYRQLEPSSRYVFRVLARNRVGVGRPSAESEQLFVPASLPEDPFWNQWWFLVIVGLVIVLVVFLFIATLCWTTSGGARNHMYGTMGAAEKKNGSGDAFDTLQLSDGGIVSYELHSKHVKRAEELSRPNTHTSWISAMAADTLTAHAHQPLRSASEMSQYQRHNSNYGNNGRGQAKAHHHNNGSIYGGGSLLSAAAGGVSAPFPPAVNSMYEALATDALPRSATNASIAIGGGGAFGGSEKNLGALSGGTDDYFGAAAANFFSADSIGGDIGGGDATGYGMFGGSHQRGGDNNNDNISKINNNNLLQNFNAAAKFQHISSADNFESVYGSGGLGVNKVDAVNNVDDYDENEEDAAGDLTPAERNFASHYASRDDAMSRATWRRARKAAAANNQKSRPTSQHNNNPAAFDETPAENAYYGGGEIGAHMADYSDNLLVNAGDANFVQARQRPVSAASSTANAAVGYFSFAPTGNVESTGVPAGRANGGGAGALSSFV